MRLTGEDLEASAPGAGKRADFLLLAYKRGENPHPHVLGFAYHTTNAVPETVSGNAKQKYPETRVLWYMHVPLPGLMEEAATSLTRSLYLPEPRHTAQEIPKILDEDTWVHTVLQPPAEAMDAEPCDPTRDAATPAEAMDAEPCDQTRDAATMSDAEDDDAETSAEDEEISTSDAESSTSDTSGPDWSGSSSGRS